MPEEYGHVKFCISKLYPGVVGEECFMTKGHYHTVLETGEIYLCLRGQGLMMMKLADGPADGRSSSRAAWSTCRPTGPTDRSTPATSR